jgi:hypothetical protein
MSVNSVQFWLAIISAAVGLLIALWVIYRLLIRPVRDSDFSATLPDSLPAHGFEVPIVDAFGGIKDVDQATITQNVQKPRLILFQDHLDYKLFFRRSAKYSDILEVNCGVELMLYFLQFTFNNRNLVLNVTLGDEKLFYQIKEFLSAKGVMVIDQVQ